MSFWPHLDGPPDLTLRFSIAYELIFDALKIVQPMTIKQSNK
jgi:hypothetical protein